MSSPLHLGNSAISFEGINERSELVRVREPGFLLPAFEVPSSSLAQGNGQHPEDTAWVSAARWSGRSGAPQRQLGRRLSASRAREPGRSSLAVITLGKKSDCL